MSEYNRHKWAMEWMHGGGRDPNGRSLDDEIRIGKEDWLESQRVTQGGRMGLKPGGLVEPGVTHYGKDDELGDFIYEKTRDGNKYYELEVREMKEGKRQSLYHKSLKATPDNLKLLQNHLLLAKIFFVKHFRARNRMWFYRSK